eukprot:240396_1
MRCSHSSFTLDVIVIMICVNSKETETIANGNGLIIVYLEPYENYHIKRAAHLSYNYSGLSGVKMNIKSVRSGYFVTYTSTTWQKEVAKEFMDGDGMIVTIDKEFKNEHGVKCCDMSWISKFPDEC